MRVFKSRFHLNYSPERNGNLKYGAGAYSSVLLFLNSTLQAAHDDWLQTFTLYLSRAPYCVYSLKMTCLRGRNVARK